MQLEEYKRAIKNEADPALLSVWTYLAKNARETSDQVKVHDPNLALILRGLANQYSLFSTHLQKKKTQIEQEEFKAKENEPIDSTQVLELTEEELKNSDSEIIETPKKEE